MLVLGLPISIIGVKFHENYNNMVVKLRAQEEKRRARAADMQLGTSRGMLSIARKILGPKFKPGVNVLSPVMERKIHLGVENVFKAIDADNSGMLDRAELGNALKKMGLALKIESLFLVFKEIDSDKKGGIDIFELEDFVFRVIRGQVPAIQLKTADIVRGSGGRSAGGRGDTVFY